MKKILNIFLVIGLILSLLTPAIAVAKDSHKLHKIGDKKALKSGEEATYLGVTPDGRSIWQAVLGEPVYLPETEIPYDVAWYKDGDAIVNGDNTFDAVVSGETVTLTMDGKSAKWTPTLFLDNKPYKPDKAQGKIVNVDRFNHNYRDNMIEWIYLDGKVKRYLRSIEGVIAEFWIITEDLNKNIHIVNDITRDAGFDYFRDATAYDADNNIIPLTDILHRDIYVDKEDLKNVKYPVTIDPDITVYSSAYDGYIKKSGAVYATQRTATTGDYITTTMIANIVGQNDVWDDGTSYAIYRSFLYFDTSVIDDSANITAVDLDIYGYSLYTDVNFNIVVQNGQPTYPHTPLQASDYLYTYYSDNGGTLGTHGFSVIAYNTISLTADGISWIDKTGMTKLALRSYEDINNSAPSQTQDEYLLYYTYEQGTGFRPRLVVTYATQAPDIEILDASNLGVTSARLNSVVTDDGTEDCRVSWAYDTVSFPSADNFTEYANVTAWTDYEYNVGDHPYYDATGLTSDTTWYARVRIENSDSVVVSDEITFDTYADTSLAPPSNLRAFPHVDYIDFQWVKGTGATKTMLRASTDDFPTDNASGIQIYYGTLSTYTWNDVSAGYTYYISAFSWSGDNCSETYSTVAVTTFGYEEGTGDNLTTPDVWARWFSPPDYTNLSNMGVFYDSVNTFADGIGTNRGNVWYGGYSFILAAGISVTYYLTRSAPAMFVCGALGLCMGAAVHLIPVYFVFIPIVIYFGAWSMNKRGVADG